MIRARFRVLTAAIIAALLMAVALPPAYAGINQWTANGPRSASLDGIAVDPSGGIYLTTSGGGGIFKSVNSGLTWGLVNSSNPNCWAGFVVDRTAPGTVYAACRGQVLKTTNGGASWQAVNTGMVQPDARAGFAISASNPSTLYVASYPTYGGSQGVFKTTNGGTSWVAVNNGLSGAVPTLLTVDPTNPNIVYAAQGGTIYKTTDGGSSWAQITSPTPSSGIYRIVVDPSAPSTLYARADNSVYKSVNGGSSWSSANSGLPSISGGTALTLDPSNPLILYVWGNSGTLYRSTNGAATWNAYGTGPNNVRDVVFDPTGTRLYALDGSSAYKSTNGGITWAAANRGVVGEICLTVAQDPSDARTLYVGGYSGVHKTTNGGSTWASVASGYTGSLAVSRSNPNTLYRTGSGSNTVFKSTDGGATWVTAASGLPSGQGNSVRIDPGNPNVAYVGTSGGVYKTTTGGTSWVAATSGLPAGFARVLAIDETAPSTLFATVNSGVFKTTDGGSSWTSAGLALQSINDFSIDPTNNQRLYALSDGVYRSVDGGGSWTRIAQVYLTRLAIDAATPTTLYGALSGGGVSKSTDGGVTWTPLGSGLSNLDANAVLVDAATPSTIYAATRNGFFDLEQLSGDAFVADRDAAGGSGAIVQVSPAGSQRVASSGGQFVDPEDVVLDGFGELLVADPGSQKIVRIRAGGAQTVVAAAGVFVSPARLTVSAANGEIFVADRSANLIVRVDPVTGSQTSVASISSPAGVAFEKTGMLLVTSGARLMRVDPASGASVVVSQNGSFVTPGDITVNSRGDALVVDQSAGAVIRVDTGTGAQAIVASGGNLTGPRGISAATPTSLLIAGGSAPRAVVSVTDSGTQTLLASGGNFATPAGLAAVECLIDADCNDDIACTTDTCSAGACVFRFAQAGTSCANDGNPCSVDQCDGSSVTCQHPAGNAGAICRASAGACDVAEACTGGSTVCPADGFSSAGTSCIDDGNVCTNDLCNGAGACTHPNNTNPCDNGLYCDGTDTCAAGSCSVHTGDPCAGGTECADSCNEALDSCNDAVGTPCADDGSTCSLDVCDGTGTCSHPAGNAGATCRASAGDCDLAETCNGASPTCPTDLFRPSSHTCRSATGECDVAEQCSGVSADCPVNEFVAAGTSCTDDGQLCTNDACDGDGACEHLPLPDSDGDAVCDAQDVCTNIGNARDFVTKPKSRLIVSKVNTDTVAGNEKLVLKGSFNLPAGVDFGDLDPRTHGARVLVRTTLGSTVLDVALPAGSYAGKGTRGWKTNTKGSFWQYLDETVTPVNGVTGLKANDKSKGAAGGLVALTVSGKDGTYPVASSDALLEAVVVLGNQTDAIAGMCGESAYIADDCAFNGTGNSLKCQR